MGGAQGGGGVGRCSTSSCPLNEGLQDVSVTAQIGKISWQSVKDKGYHKVTLHNKPHTRDYWEGKAQEGGCLCLDKKQQRTEQKPGLYRVSCRGGDQSFPWCPGVGKIICPDHGARSGISGLFFRRAGPGHFGLRGEVGKGCNAIRELWG